MKFKFSIILLLILILSLFFLKKEEMIPSANQINNQFHEVLNLPIKKEIQNKTIKLVQQFSSEIGNIHNDPVAAELHMRNTAKSLTETELEQLEKIILDSNLNQDDRFVALTFLSWSNNSKVALSLVDIATTPFDPLLNPNQKGDFEKILRMSAVEGLNEIPLHPHQRVDYLNQIVSKSELEPIADRAMRILWAEQKLAKPVADQDQDALKKLLSSP